MDEEMLTYDDVVQIATEIAEQTVKTFLKNLIKLVPTAEETEDAIRTAQYKELQALRSGAKPKAVKAAARAPEISAPIIDLEEDVEEDEFAAIAHPERANKLNEAYNMDDALSQIPLERSDLFGEAAQSPVD